MHADLVMQMMTDLFRTAFLVCLPVLGATMIVGLLVSMLQVVTQIQEASLAFIPKLAAASLSLVVCGPWVMRTLTAYSVRLWSSIPLMF